VPELLKLRTAGKAICDSYAKQWLESVHTDLKNYDEFKNAFKELLWNASIQAQVMNSIYLDKYSKISGETLCSHFLMYSAKGAYLSPKLSEFDLVTAVASHYPEPCVGSWVPRH
jgi:hypothetical protein